MTRQFSKTREFRIISDGHAHVAQWRWRQPKWYQSAKWRDGCHRWGYLTSAQQEILWWQREDVDWYEVPLK